MMFKERLHQLVEALSEEQAERLLAQLEDERKDRSGEWPASFLETFGGWAADSRTTEEIVRDIRESRSPSTRNIDL